MSPQDALARYFGFPAFRSGQEEALQHVLSGRDTLVVMPTGSGKSLIYQLAALMLPGTTLVFSPLVALMKDQVDSLTRRHIPATFVNSALDATEQARRLRALANSECKIILVAPERLRNAAFRTALARVKLSLVVIDEAHCLSHWGHDFRPDYLHIAEARREFGSPLTLALTATATVRVQDDIIRLLGLTHAEKLVKGFNRPNLFLQVVTAPDVKTKLKRVREFLLANEGAGIIYTGTRREAEEVAEFVRTVVHKDARHYHAGLEADLRNSLQDAFMAGDLPLIVATNAFGMGVDRPDVRFVLHYSLPGSLEAYYQEAGRAGRDGLPAQAILIYSPRDISLHERFIENDSPTAPDLRAVHEFVKQHSETTWDAIERGTGLPEVKTRVALEQLEQAESVKRAGHEEFGVLHMQAAPLSEGTLRAIAAQTAARRQHKLALLQRMVAYAQTNACRRRAILDYFGDNGSADTPLCCDNDLARASAAQVPARPAESDAERAALVALEAVAGLKWGLGKEKLAMLLKGSQSEKVKMYVRHPHFAKLAAWRGKDIESLIEQLMAADYLKQVGSDKPVLKLTPRGDHARRTRAAVPVHLRTPDLAAFQKRQSARVAGGTLELTAQILARGGSPEQIATERGLAVTTIYSHLAQLIAAGRADVNAIVPAELQRQIRAAIDQVGSTQFLAPIKALLPEDVDYNVIRCVVNAWTREHADRSLSAASNVSAPETTNGAERTDPIAAFLACPHPRRLEGPWLAGWALDFHSRFDGDEQSRSVMGELVFRFKYQDERALASELAGHWAKLLSHHPELPKPDAVIPIPPSVPRAFDPVTALAHALAAQLGIAPPAGVLAKTRSTRPQKEMTSLAQKKENVVGAFIVRGDIRGRNVILVDDLFDSGATLSEAARVLARAGAAKIVVLALTKTIHADR